MILPRWNLDTDNFHYRIRVKDKCVLTDEVGYRHFYTTKAFCASFEIPYYSDLSLESLVDSEQAVWAELTEDERIAYNKERPWWKKLKERFFCFL